LMWHDQKLPWIALTLAVSFGFYGLIRKTVAVSPTTALTVECVVLAPAACFFLLYAATASSGSMHQMIIQSDWRTAFLLSLAGVVTAIPLLMFGAAAKRLSLRTLGFVQYIGPTCQFVMAVFWYQQPWTNWQLASFAIIWVALMIYTIDSIVRRNDLKN